MYFPAHAFRPQYLCLSSLGLAMPWYILRGLASPRTVMCVLDTEIYYEAWRPRTRQNFEKNFFENSNFS